MPRRACGAPWVNDAARNRNPNGVLQIRYGAYRSFVQHEHRHERRAIVQPRWGNHIAVSHITRGTRHGREPRAMECNAFGVGTMCHIDRYRDGGHPNGDRSIGTHPPITGFYAEGVTFQSPGSPRQRRTLGQRRRAEPKPQRGFTNSVWRVPIVRATRTPP